MIGSLMRPLIVLLVCTLGIGINKAGEKDQPSPAPNATPPRLMVQLGHSGPVTAVAFSPNGRLFVTGGTDKTVRIWDVSSGKEIRVLQGHTEGVTSVAFSRDGARLVTCAANDRAVRLWDAASGKEIRTFVSGDPFSKFSGTFSPDGTKLLVGSELGISWLWEVETGKLIRTLQGHTGVVRSVAFSQDGLRAVTGSLDKTARIWNTATGETIHTLRGHKNGVQSVAFSLDGQQVITGSLDKTARLWDAVNGKEIRAFEEQSAVFSAAFSPDGKNVITGTYEKGARLWDAANGKEVRSFKGEKDGLTSVAFSPDGQQVLTGSHVGPIRLSDTATGKELRVFQSRVGAVTPIGSFSATFSRDSKLILAGSWDKSARLWDLTVGSEIAALRGHRDLVNAVAISPNGKQLLTASSTARLWDTASAREIRVFDGHNFGVSAVGFSADGKQVLTAGSDKTARLRDAASGQSIRTFKGHKHVVDSVVLSTDGKKLLTGSRDGDALLWNESDGRQILAFPAEIFWPCSVAISPDGRQVLTGGRSDKTARLWNAVTGKEILVFHGHADHVQSVAFSPDCKQVLTGSADHTARLWDTANGKEIRTFHGHSRWVSSACFSQDGKWVLTGSADATVRLWDAASGRELCQLLNLSDSTYAVIAPDGRFDTDNLDEIKGLHWIMPDEPFTPLPVEIFMRDYYEPRLLARILAGEKFEPVRSLASVNRVQPKVEIAKIEPQPGADDEVIVTVAVTGQARTIGDRVVASGAQDVQLFRDGQLVASFPDPEGAIELDAKTLHKTVRFEHIRLPRLAGQKEVEFTAYAFNKDRVKSATARRSHPIPVGAKARPRTAYVIAVGVNAFDESRLDLRYAVPDAKVLAKTMHETLTAQKQFERVVVVPLLADGARKDGKQVFTERTATKATIQAVLRLLGGHKADAALLKQVPNAHDLAPARPEDLVLIAFSTHGHNGKDGQFHLLPSDNEQTISTDDLARWLRDVDAGEMILIVDACHSAGAIEQKGFKPGPMGSRGFGQLAYNKRMRILAASQAADVAFEDAGLGHGLLTYALIDDGLKNRLADFSPKDEQITLGEWLRYGVQRVPALADEIAAGKRQAASSEGRTLVLPIEKRGLVLDFEGDVKQRQGLAQQPALFDFTRRGDELVLSRKKMP